ncbi:hypothetical protein SAMN04488065_1625 [Haloplanus vescus]|uniref:Uncharacterized protein n=1 Tax=Haloplanus vescus TaxID=555874 RepID=A0A1H3Y2P5_9EURY|nr:hypothetical protein [Haloplanus vescus]SEA05843.1 hypothetical protein SAMN04488065_1625 [Haloplanus vescus]
MTITAEQYATELRDAIDRQRYATLVASVGDQLNGRKDRFDKSDIIERCLEVYSDGRLKWVDDVKRDFVDTERGVDVEFKYETDMLYTKVRGDPRDPNPRLINNLGEKNEIDPDELADFFVLGQQDAMGVISKPTIFSDETKSELEFDADVVKGDFYFDEIEIAFSPDDIGAIQTREINYKERKMEMQMRLIESIGAEVND